MRLQLPEDVCSLLRDNPDIIDDVSNYVRSAVSAKLRTIEYQKRRQSAKMVACGTFGCTNLKNEMDIFCESCRQDYNEDPDAFK